MNSSINEPLSLHNILFSLLERQTKLNEQKINEKINEKMNEKMNGKMNNNFKNFDVETFQASISEKLMEAIKDMLTTYLLDFKASNLGELEKTLKQPLFQIIQEIEERIKNAILQIMLEVEERNNSKLNTISKRMLEIEERTNLKFNEVIKALLDMEERNNLKLSTISNGLLVLANPFRNLSSDRKGIAPRPPSRDNNEMNIEESESEEVLKRTKRKKN